MKTEKEIKALESAIYNAQINYFRAILTNLKEIGKEVDLINDEIGDVGLTLTNIDDDGNCEVDVVDKVRYNDNGRGESFEVHIIKCDGKKCDSWVSIDCFNHDCSMYIFANIKWKE